MIQWSAWQTPFIYYISEAEIYGGVTPSSMAGTKYSFAEKGAAIRSIMASLTNGYSQWDAYVAKLYTM